MDFSWYSWTFPRLRLANRELLLFLLMERLFGFGGYFSLGFHFVSRTNNPLEKLKEGDLR